MKAIKVLGTETYEKGTRVYAEVQTKIMVFTITHEGLFANGIVVADDHTWLATTADMADLAQLWIEQFGTTALDEVASDITK